MGGVTMDDLMKCLYGFMLEHRLGSLHEDPEYEQAAFDASIQEKRVRESLDQEQRKELDQFINMRTLQDSLMSEHIFRAALALSRELNDLLRA